MVASLPPMESLLDSTFGRLFSDAERAELRARVRAWEAENAGRPPAERVVGWIDVVYAYQAERDRFLDTGAGSTRSSRSA